MKDKTRMICFMSVLASLYFVMTIIFSPISYGPVQIRISDILQPFVLFGWQYNVAIAIGTLIANLNSPFGIVDFSLMPIVSLIAGYVSYIVSNKLMKFKYHRYIGMLIYANVIAMGVGLVLCIGAGVPYLIGYAGVFVSGIIANFTGVPIVNKLVATLKNKGFDV